MNKKICVYMGGRANYSSAKSVLDAVRNHPDLELQVIVGAAAVISRFGDLAKLIESDGFPVRARFYSLVEGETPLTMAKSAGLSIIEASTVFDSLGPDVVLVVGDRYDVLPVAVAAAYMNIIVAHTMGGEVTGTIDESIRHALTKLSHLHFAANEDARSRIIRMGENPEFVHNVGCPRNDLVLEETKSKASRDYIKNIFRNHGGVGPVQDLRGDFLLVSQHSVTTEYGRNREWMNATLAALDRLAMPTLLLWPNSDAGSDEISKAVRTFREGRRPDWLHVFKDLPVEMYIHLMNTAACLIGNSSSGIREGALLGTPVVNVGSRQTARMCGKNVISVANDATEIELAIRRQLSHGRYSADSLYGDGNAGSKIAAILSKANPVLQKIIAY